MHSRREKAGVRRSDTARAVATGPWHLVRSLLGLVPSLLVASSVVVILLGVAWWLIGEGHWAIDGSPSGQEPRGVTASLLVAAILMIGVCIVWWGPLSRMTRVGARRVLAVVAPGRKGAALATAILLGVTAIFVTLILTGTDITWAPFPEPTLPDPPCRVSGISREPGSERDACARVSPCGTTLASRGGHRFG